MNIQMVNGKLPSGKLATLQEVKAILEQSGFRPLKVAEYTGEIQVVLVFLGGMEPQFRIPEWGPPFFLEWTDTISNKTNYGFPVA